MKEKEIIKKCNEIFDDFIKCKVKLNLYNIAKCREINHFYYTKCNIYNIDKSDYEFLSYTDLN